MEKTTTENNDSTATPLVSQICAVIVTFNPDATLEQNVRALLSEVEKIIVVDNRSTDECRTMIAEIASSAGIEVVWNQENEGIATALNKGIHRALSRKDYRWIATFDQDSCVFPGFMAAMINAYQACPFREQVALISPYYVHYVDHSGHRKANQERGQLFKELPTAMTSGNLLDPKSVRVTGMLDDSFFIDYVDHEFCFRLRRHGFRIIEACGAKLEHRLGSRTLHRILTRTVVTSNYGPLRRYYNTRNRLRVYRHYLFAEPSWIASDIYAWFKDILKLILFETDRKAKLISIVRGAWDAIRGVNGAAPAARVAGRLDKASNLNSSEQR